MEGVSFKSLQIVKGRDGVQRGAIELMFWYKQSRIEEKSTLWI